MYAVNILTTLSQHQEIIGSTIQTMPNFVPFVINNTIDINYRDIPANIALNYGKYYTVFVLYIFGNGKSDDDNDYVMLLHNCKYVYVPINDIINAYLENLDIEYFIVIQNCSRQQIDKLMDNVDIIQSYTKLAILKTCYQPGSGN